MRISLQAAASALKSGQVVAVPTETVYGLAAALNSKIAVEDIFKLKSRPSDNPLIIHVNELDQIESLARALPEDFYLLASAFWPGPMTLVLPVNIDAVPSIARAGLPTAAFRIPRHPLALQLLALTGPLVMPSANISGSPSATSVEHVEADFGDNFPILEGGGMPERLRVHYSHVFRRFLAHSPFGQSFF